MTAKRESLKLFEMKRLRRWVWIFVAVSVVVGIAHSCNGIYKRFNPDSPYVQAKRAADDPMALTRHVRINGVDLRIPIPYFESRIPGEGEQTDALLQTMYPGFGPLRESRRAIRERGEWYRNVRWLIQDSSKRKNIDELLPSAMQSNDATGFVRVEHGLHYYTQPEGVKNSHEMWIEGDLQNPVSFITCSKQDQINVPQCAHLVWQGRLFYRISYDRRMLAEWQAIRAGILGLTADFTRTTDPDP